jgi:hypothetical protein
MDCSRPKTRDPEEWLETAPAFSRPLAGELRDLILRSAPDLTESIKWNLLAFTGRKLVCGISACKKHISVAFFRGTELPDPGRLFGAASEGNTNIRSIRLTTLAGFDRAAFRALLHAAMELDDQRDVPPAPKVRREPWPVPDFFAAVLKKNRRAAAGFARLSPSCQREYLVWLTSAKRPETRQQRLQQTLAAVASGYKWADRKRAGTPCG